MTPPTPQEMIAGINASLAGGNALSHSLVAGTDGSEALEVFVFALVVDEAAKANWSVDYEDTSGNIERDLLFRSSPSSLTTGDYTHAVLQPENRDERFEVHAGVYIRGRSNAAHECDVSIIRRGPATTARDLHDSPTWKALFWFAEAKYYVDSSVGVGMARGFIGLCTELAGPGRSAFVATRMTAPARWVVNRHFAGNVLHPQIDVGGPSEASLRAVLATKFI